MKSRELTEHRSVLGFTPRDAVRWLSPVSLARTALKVMAATVFADFGDKRELEGGFPDFPLDLDRFPVPGQPAQPAITGRGLGRPRDLTAAADASARELWLDFTADLGDGFDATYTVASLLAQEKLEVGGYTLPRGRVLVLGGDEVYPVASPAAYEDRMAGPYRLAFPARAVPGASRPGTPPVMLALPGNHDWYDGLTSFIRLFTRQRSIVAWRTIQSRSYFAVRLSGRNSTEDQPGVPGWWLLGLDSQLGQYIDEPQLDYFYEHATTRLVKGDAIILCVAAPSWVHAEAPVPGTAGDGKASDGKAHDRQPDAGRFRQLNFFEQDYLRRRFTPDTGLFEATGANVRLWLSGDLHHYSRYEQRRAGEPAELPPDPARVQLVTCGLGGAYLSDAHWLPPEVMLPAPAAEAAGSAAPPPAAEPASQAASAAGRRFVRTPGFYPPPAESRRLGRRLATPFSTYWLPVRNPGFGMALGFAQVVAFLGIWTVFSAFRGQSFVESLRSLESWLPVVLPTAVPLALLGLLTLLANWLGGQGAGPVIFARGLLFQLAALGVGTAVVVLLPWPQSWPDVLTAVLALLVVHLGGWAVGSEAFALFILSTPNGEVSSWRMSGQAIEDHKGFLRLHLSAEGTVTVYPVTVDAICRDWQLAKNDDGARLVPSTGLPAVRLLEQPITIAREGTLP